LDDTERGLNRNHQDRSGKGQLTERTEIMTCPLVRARLWSAFKSVSRLAILLHRRWLQRFPQDRFQGYVEGEFVMSRPHLGPVDSLQVRKRRSGQGRRAPLSLDEHSGGSGIDMAAGGVVVLSEDEVSRDRKNFFAWARCRSRIPTGAIQPRPGPAASCSAE